MLKTSIPGEIQEEVVKIIDEYNHKTFHDYTIEGAMEAGMEAFPV